MPKAKPTQVVVHRIEMGQYERDMVKPLLDARTKQGQIKAAAMMGAAGATGVAAYAFYKWAGTVTGWVGGIVEDAKSFKENLFLLGDEDNKNNNVDVTSADSYGYPFQLFLGGGGQAPAGNDVNILGLPGWGIVPGVI